MYHCVITKGDSMESKNKSWQDFVEHCLKFSDEKSLGRFFDVIFTPSEKIEFGNRLKIMQELLKNEKTQREIAKSLEVSIANISRGSNIIKNSTNDLKIVLKI